MKILKILLISVVLLVILVVGLFFGSIWYYSWQDSKFYNIEIPEGENYEKPTEYLNHAQIDSVKALKVNSDKIAVVGTGYGGYDFYMWHKPTEKGELYIKGFEITKNRQLSKRELTDRTKNSI